MPEHLETRLRDLRQRLRQMTWLYGLSWLVAVVFGATLAVGLLDWSLRLEDAGVRLILGLGILASATWISWRLLLRPLRRQISDVEIALRIERRYPGFNDSLASTVQFLKTNADPHLGSPEMQKQVVERTVAQVERVNLSDIVETRRVRKVALAAVGICLLAAMIAGLNQAAAATALHRLMFPFANRPWPKTTELRLVNEDLEPLQFDAGEPLRLAAGDTLEVYVENLKGRLPEDVRMEYRFDEEEVIAETLRRTSLRGSDGNSKDVGIATIIATKGPMFFRAVGGDDLEMPWQMLEVVPPPEVDTLQLTLTPPAYSRQKAETLAEGVGHVRGLLGTRVQLKATTNKPLQSAQLRVKDFPPVRVPISSDGRKLEAEFLITEPGVYSWWLDLKDLKGFQNANAPRYEVRGTADLVPDVWIDEPPRDKNVTPTAMVPIIVGAKDDLGLKSIRLMHKVGDDPETAFSAIPLLTGEDRPEQHRVEYEWELAGLDLKPGQQILFHAEALDDYDLDGEHVGRSIDRKLTIVSPEEKSAELTFQQGGLLEELEAAFKMQSQTHDQIEELKIQLKKAGELRPQDIDLLKRLEIEQRQIGSRLSHPAQGLTAHTEELLEELKQNKIDDPEMEARLRGIAIEIGILEEDHLPIIEQELTNARKLAQTRQGLTPEDGEQPPEGAPSLARDEETSLDRADDHQRAVLDTLSEMLAQLSEWRHHRDLTGEVRELITNQEAINRETGEIGRRTFGKRPDDLTPQEQADLARLADRQRKQAQRVGDLSKSFDEITKKLKETSPQAAEILSDAQGHLREQAIAGNLQEASNQMTRNQIGEAVGQQNDALADLNELSDILKNRSVSDTETLVKKLKEARSQLEELRKRQEELNQKTEEAEQLTNPSEREQALEKLRQEQEEIRREVSSLARRLRRLEAQQPGSSLRRAAARMEQAEQLLQENQPNQAEEEQQEVLEDLEQAERELAEEEQKAQERLARELLERIADELKSMIAREQTVIDETNRLEALRRERGNWSRAQLKSLRDLAEVQRGLKTETDRLVEVVKAAEVFALALQGASREMERAAKRLEDRLTDGETIARETAARHRFEDLISALETEKDQAPAEDPAENGGEGQPTTAGPQTDGIPHLAQLKMLKTLQEDLIRRTEELDKLSRETGDLTQDQRQEFDQLAGEQGLLADLTRNLTAQFVEAFQAEPEQPGPEKPMHEPAKKTEPDKPPKKPTLEEELNRELDLDNLLPESKEEGAKSGAQADRRHSGRMFFASAQIDLEKTTPGETEPKANPPGPAEKKPDPGVDAELFRGLTGKEPAGGDLSKNPLEEAISGMRSAQERIQGQDAGQETREIQEDVVANLEKLIDLMKNNPNRPPSSSGQPQPQNQKPEPQTGEPQPMPRPSEAGSEEQPQTQQEQKPTVQESESAKESTEDQRDPRNANANLSRRQEMLTEVWGHLPPSVRTQLLSLGGDKYLPKYEDLARRYFEALAEPDRNSRMKTP